jgi:adenylosuccinate synthase
MLDGVTELIMMKADVLDTFDTIKVAVGYKVDGVETDQVPYDTYAEIEPVYKEFKGWNCDICNIQNYDDFPAELKEYIEFIEKETGIPIWIVSVGADRKATIFRQ